MYDIAARTIKIINRFIIVKEIINNRFISIYKKIKRYILKTINLFKLVEKFSVLVILWELRLCDGNETDQKYLRIKE